MDGRQKVRLEKYLLNADRFMFGLGPGNQKETYSWLERKGFSFAKAKYSLVLQQLLRYPNPGVEGLLKIIIIPSVKSKFPNDTLDFLRKQWNIGELPDLKQLNNLKINGEGPEGPFRAFHWRPFLEISTQFEYVERWGELAGIWFEEIEPWINDEESGNKI